MQLTVIYCHTHIQSERGRIHPAVSMPADVVTGTPVALRFPLSTEWQAVAMPLAYVNIENRLPSQCSYRVYTGLVFSVAR